MNATRALRQAAQAAHHRTPLIKFLGKRTPPASIDHAPHAHPASPSGSLPGSFAAYRDRAQQHGPLNHSVNSSPSYGAIGGQPGGSLGPVEAPKGLYFDRNELPARFRRMPWTDAEIEAVESGGASLFS
ncbi:MAG: hypothetical protein M1834_003319 [Cirrosporium novae-zelandiae]|nr:MAG: hypothetical protein M1834_003319 [Cirrosporium novae-zelandiae]